MAQILDLLFVLFIVFALARQVPAVIQLLNGARRSLDHDRRAVSPSSPVRVIDLVLCEKCRLASPASARFCSRCGEALRQLAS